MIRTGLFLWILFVVVPALAEQPITDIGIEVSVQSERVIPPGSEGMITIKTINHGESTATVLLNWLATSDGAGSSFPPLEFPTPVTGPCVISSVIEPGPGDFFGFWVTSDILPGESRICTFGFRVFETKLISKTARWRASVFGADDPNQENNVDEALLLFSPLADIRPVTALSWLGLFTLILLTVVISIRQMVKY